MHPSFPGRDGRSTPRAQLITIPPLDRAYAALYNNPTDGRDTVNCWIFIRGRARGPKTKRIERIKHCHAHSTQPKRRMFQRHALVRSKFSDSSLGARLQQYTSVAALFGRGAREILVQTNKKRRRQRRRLRDLLSLELVLRNAEPVVEIVGVDDAVPVEVAGDHARKFGIHRMINFRAIDHQI